jgi:SAM-dependent methyltransferase
MIEGSTSSEAAYQRKIREEVTRFREVTNVHDLPAIFHYWSNKHLLPRLRVLGFDNSEQFYLSYLLRACRAPQDECIFVSIGSGNCELEVKLVESLQAADCDDFLFECLDVNGHMLERGAALARERGVLERMQFVEVDINGWNPAQSYQVIIANHALHHFVELEILFDKIRQYLDAQGYFLTHDMIGRNGHMRWPETLQFIRTSWRHLPDKYKYNHQLKRMEIEFDNWDCSADGFEGIRAQDILPLLVERFSFELFVGWGGVIDIFVDRGFGHSFDPEQEWDRNFIDEVERLSETSS